MRRLNLVDSVDDLRERLVPGDRFPSVAVAAHRLLQPVRVVVQVLERGGLRADVTFAEHVFVVAADREDSFAFDLDFDAAHRFTEVAGPSVDFACLGHAPEHTRPLARRVAAAFQLTLA